MAAVQLSCHERLRRAVALGPAPWILGHRGAPHEAIENTLESFARAAAAGADAVELDVQLTADDELAVFHDWSCERLAGETLIVEQVPWSALVPLRLRDPSHALPAASIPRLADVFAALPAGLPVNVELKRRRADPGRYVEALLASLASRHRVWVSSFDWDLLALLRRRAPDLPLAPLASRRRRRFTDVASELGAVSLHCDRRVVSGALLERSRAAGLPLLVYTVNDPDEASALFSRGVAGVFTDEPRALDHG